ncbi:hypothetical protein GCM10022393_36170 [Aquimarina addita]|uniref:DUF4476 domain-containing protein n=1 Tax=Aquimarina addita TaxID=870485 RepID=A0ABP6UTS2_9FLAO
MKNKLESELISIAHRILRLSGRSEISQLQEEAKNLYEKLTILNFSESHFLESEPTLQEVQDILDNKTTFIPDETTDINPPQPSISLQETVITEYEESKEPFTNVTSINAEDIPVNIKTDHSKTVALEDEKPEIVIEKINEKISEDLFVPATNIITEENISFSEPVYEKNDKEDIGTGGQSMPIIDPVKETDKKPKSLNDQLKKGIHIGLNDRLAFIKHLFNGSSTDYNRVLSQLNTLNSKSGARQFVKNMVKPDYNNWVGKEEYETRFMEIVTNKFEF